MHNSYNALVDYISLRYNPIVEIGIGHFSDVASALAVKGVTIFATDIKPFRYKCFKCVIDDITQPDLWLYAGSKLVYSIRPPLELVPYMIRLAEKISADLIVKPLSDEHPGGQLITRENTTFFLWSNP